MALDLAIVEKELKDYLTSKRFTFLLIILLLLVAYSLITGIDNYHLKLSIYNSQLVSTSAEDQKEVATLTRQLQLAGEQGADTETLRNLEERLSSYYPPMPTALDIFNSFKTIFL